MNKMISVTIPVEPKGQKRVSGGKFKHRFKDGVQRSREQILLYYLNASPEKPSAPLTGALRLRVKAYFARPKAHYGSKKKVPYLKADAPLFHTSTPDADNIAKMLQDVMNGLYFEDDRQIVILNVMKAYTDNGEGPRWELTLDEV